MGLTLLFIVVMWLGIVCWLVWQVVRKMPKRWWNLPVALLLIVVLFPLPLIDEIVGGMQFRELCQKNSTIEVDRAKAAGRSVYLAESSNTEIKGTWVRVVLKPWQYVDATTRETIVSFNTLQAAGGWFVHAFPLSEGRVPLTFNGYCAPGGSRRTASELFKELGITSTKRPDKVGVTK